jgi:hypothetical protein
LNIDGTLIREHRLTAGYSTREFAQLSRTTITVINSIEKESYLDPNTPISIVHRIATLCGLQPRDILINDNQIYPNASNSIDTLKRTAALLVQDARLHRKPDVAKALGITLKELNDNCYPLQVLLNAAGLRLHWNSAAIGIRPYFTESIEDFRKLHQSRISRKGYTVTDAKLIAQALYSQLNESPKRSERPLLGRLLKAGVLAPGKTTDPLHVLTSQAAYAFDISIDQNDSKSTQGLSPPDARPRPINRQSAKGKRRHQSKLKVN